MKKYYNLDKIILVLFLIGLLAAVFVVVQRERIETAEKNYDIVVDYTDYALMADQSDFSIGEWLKFFSNRGVTKVALFETNLNALGANPQEKIWCKTTEGIKSDPDWREDYPEEVISLLEASEYRSDLLVICEKAEEAKWIADAFRERLDDVKLKTVTAGDHYYLWIYDNADGSGGKNLTEFSLGLWPKQVKTIEENGCVVIPRTKTVDGINSARFGEAVFREFAQYDPPYFMNSGDSLVGFDEEEWAKPLVDYLEKTGAAFAVTETMTEQGNIQWPGSNQFVQSIDYNAVRVFNAWNFVMERYGVYHYSSSEEIVNSFYRAVYERNCRILYLKGIVDADKTKDDGSPSVYITDPQAYDDLVVGIKERMARYGFTFDTVTPMRANHPSALLYFLIGIGEVAAAVLLLSQFTALKRKTQLILTAIGILCVAAALFVMPSTSKILLSLAGGTVMPCLAAVGINRYLQASREKEHSFGRILFEAVVTILALFAIAFCGALFVAASLSDSEYILELSLYRGVKVMQLLPLLIFLISALQVFFLERSVYSGGDVGFREKKERWNQYLDTSVKRRGVFLMMIAAAVVCFIGLLGVYYIIRTGNIENDLVPTLEIEIRNFMEEFFVARPRTKEFLIGYPCIAMMIWAYRRHIPGVPLICGVGAMVGLVSIVNTFLHIRTGIFLSFCRVMIGLGLGLVFAICAVIVLEALYCLIKKAAVVFIAPKV